MQNLKHVQLLHLTSSNSAAPAYMYIHVFIQLQRVSDGKNDKEVKEKQALLEIWGMFLSI